MARAHCHEQSVTAWESGTRRGQLGALYASRVPMPPEPRRRTLLRRPGRMLSSVVFVACSPSSPPTSTRSRWRRPSCGRTPKAAAAHRRGALVGNGAPHCPRRGPRRHAHRHPDRWLGLLAVVPLAFGVRGLLALRTPAGRAGEHKWPITEGGDLVVVLTAARPRAQRRRLPPILDSYLKGDAAATRLALPALRSARGAPRRADATAGGRQGLTAHRCTGGALAS